MNGDTIIFGNTHMEPENDGPPISESLGGAEPVSSFFLMSKRLNFPSKVPKRNTESLIYGKGEELHPRKLTAACPKWWALEKVAP